MRTSKRHGIIALVVVCTTIVLLSPLSSHQPRKAGRHAVSPQPRTLRMPFFTEYLRTCCQPTCSCSCYSRNMYPSVHRDGVCQAKPDTLDMGRGVAASTCACLGRYSSTGSSEAFQCCKQWLSRLIHHPHLNRQIAERAGYRIINQRCFHYLTYRVFSAATV